MNILDVALAGRIAASGGGTAGIAGVVNTNVITSDVKTGFSNSTLNGHLI